MSGGQKVKIGKPKYEFTREGTLLFITGVALSGKSTIAPLLAVSIKNCNIQCMDMMRLVAQGIEDNKSKRERNPFIYFGSCDSYRAIGDGSYSAKNLVTGYREYSKIVCRFLDSIIVRLEEQNASNVIFEGVQLMPSIVAPYLKANNKLIIITADSDKLEQRRKQYYAGIPFLLERYTTEKLELIEGEILRQKRKLSDKSVFVIDNNEEYLQVASKIIDFLLKSKTIKLSKQL